MYFIFILILLSLFALLGPSQAMGANYFFGGSLEVSIATAAVASFNTAAIAAYMSFAPGSTAGDHDGAQPYRLVFRAVDPDMATRAGSSTALIVLPPPPTDPTATTSHKEGSGSGCAAPLIPHRGGYGELLVFFLIVGCGIAVKAWRCRASDSGLASPGWGFSKLGPNRIVWVEAADAGHQDYCNVTTESLINATSAMILELQVVADTQITALSPPARTSRTLLGIGAATRRLGHSRHGPRARNAQHRKRRYR